MKYIKLGFLFLLAITFFSNCNSDGPASTKDVTKSICECVQPVLDVNKDIEALGKAGKIDEMTNLYSKAEKAMETAVKCSKKEMNEKTDKKKLKESLIKTCGVMERLADDLLK